MCDRLSSCAGVRGIPAFTGAWREDGLRRAESRSLQQPQVSVSESSPCPRWAWGGQDANRVKVTSAMSCVPAEVPSGPQRSPGLGQAPTARLEISRSWTPTLESFPPMETAGLVIWMLTAGLALTVPRGTDRVSPARHRKASVVGEAPGARRGLERSAEAKLTLPRTRACVPGSRLQGVGAVLLWSPQLSCPILQGLGTMHRWAGVMWAEAGVSPSSHVHVVNVAV